MPKRVGNLGGHLTRLARAFHPIHPWLTTMLNLIRILVLVLVALINAPILAQSAWPTWRGPHGNGTAEPGTYPTHWSEESHIAWKIALPGRGASTPILLNKHLYLTLGNGE
ncbi:MAG: hypothetical protein ABL921_14940 [Pirellula sp.]